MSRAALERKRDLELSISHVMSALSCSQPAMPFTYVVADVGLSVAKIGKAEDVTERLWSIQSMSPVALRCIAVAHGSYALESRLHKAAERARLWGEWFNYDAALPVIMTLAPTRAGLCAGCAMPLLSAPRVTSNRTAVLAGNIRRLRAAQGMTQKQLAVAAKIPRPTMANLESGKANPTLAIMESVAVALGRSIDDLLAEGAA